MQKPDYLSGSCWESYTKTWCTVRELATEDYDIHEQMAYRVTLAIARDIPSLGHSNVASFSLSVKCADGLHHCVLPFVVSSCDVPVVDDSTAFYWQKKGPDFPIISVSQFFQDNPSYLITTADSTLFFLSNIIRAQEEGKYSGEDWRLGSGVALIQQRTSSGDYLSHLIRPVGRESGAASDVLRSVLHCEQVVFNKIMTDDQFLDTFICGLRDYLKSEIFNIDLGIVTYNDMCPKCFSTCKHRRTDFLNRLNEGFIRFGYKGKPVTSDKFRILISSHAEYKLPETGYITGKSIDSSLCTTENIFQFKNQAIPGCHKRIQEIVELRAKKCAEIDVLFAQIETASGIKAHSKSSIMDLSYSEKRDAVRKSLAQSKKDKPFPEGCMPGSPLYVTIQSENDHLARVREFVKRTLDLVTEKLFELSQIRYF